MDFANRQAYSVAEVAEVLGVCKNTKPPYVPNGTHGGVRGQKNESRKKTTLFSSYLIAYWIVPLSFKI
jgi:hypothetical protein